jgi:hypothetical protein
MKRPTVEIKRTRIVLSETSTSQCRRIQYGMFFFIFNTMMIDDLSHTKKKSLLSSPIIELLFTQTIILFFIVNFKTKM